MNQRFRSCDTRRLPAVLLPLLLLTTLLLSLPVGAANNEAPTLLLYAFDAEGGLLESRMAVDSVTPNLGRRVVHGLLMGKSVILAESGVGMTSAAMTVQSLIDSYHPARVLFSGIAGGIEREVRIGDIVICSTWVHHDFGYWGEEGFEHGPTEIWLPEQDSVLPVAAFPVDSRLLAAADFLIDESLPFDSIGDYQPSVLFRSVGASGNSFIDSPEKRQWLDDQFEAAIVDMESAAVVQVCRVNQIPCLVFRSASDLAGGSGSETAGTQLREFFRVAANNSSMVLLRYLERF